MRFRRSLDVRHAGTWVRRQCHGSGTSPETGTQRTNRILFILTAVLLLLVVVLLPLTVLSLRDEVRNQAPRNVYDFFTGQEFDFAATVPDGRRLREHRGDRYR